MATDNRPTPLGVARARFVDGLPRKAQELRGSIALLTGTPGEERPREELRRRLHALYASAQVFQLRPLTDGLKEGIARLDRAREERRALDDADLEALASLAAALPALGLAEPTLHHATATPPPGEVSPPAAGTTDAGLGPAAPARASAVPGAPRAAPPRAGAPSPSPVLRAAPSAPSPAVAPAAAPAVAPAPSPAPQAAPAVATVSDDAATTPGARAAARPPSQRPRAEPVRVARPSSRLETVVSVLVIDAAEQLARVRAALPAERFEVLGASDPDEALRLARSSAPDVVLVDHAILARPGSDVVQRLKDDPLTDFVPIVVLLPPGVSVDAVAARELGAAEALPRSVEAAELEAAVARLGGTAESRGQVAGVAGDLTIEEIAARIGDEVRRGLVESADRGRDLRVPLGDGNEVLAATWSAIGRVRAHLAHRTGGRVHFQDSRAPGGASFLALVDDEPAEGKSVHVSLRARHVLVVDDDPSVVWFFAGLLREEGAVVDEASDGVEALTLARRKRPDVVISDILMPNLDGFGLTRELKRDPALADVPVILLSWKEDFLQRMRELQSGAAGYLRKEAGSGQILDCVRECLRPRARLEGQLRAGGDVRGRLERLGMIPLLKTVAVQRPNARVTVRDAWNLFEVDVREGRIVDLTRTASDGSFTRGQRVVVPLLGATAGRFAVAETDTPVRPSIKEPLDEVLKKGAAQIGALVDAVSGKGLALAASVELDEDILSPLLRASPEPVRLLVDELLGGRGPRALLLAGAASPNELEAVLVDLARQGAILAVRGETGEDRIGLAVKSRGELELPTRLPTLPPGEEHAPLSPVPPPISKNPTLDPPPPADDDEPEVESFPDPSLLGIEDDLGARIDAETDDEAGEGAPMMLGVEEPARPAPARAQIEVPPVRGAEPRIPRPAPLPAGAPEAPPAQPADRRPDPGMGPLAWAFLAVGCAIGGYAGYRAWVQGPAVPTETAAPTTPPGPEREVADEPDAAPGPESEVAAEPGTAPDTEEPRAEVEAATSGPSSYGRDEPAIAAGFDVALGAAQGLVVLEPAPEQTELRVRFDETEHTVRAAPVGLAAEEGVHQVAFIRGDDLSFRFVRVQAGHTRFVPPP